MASGKKNYFRHSFYASKDDKIVNLITDHGKQAYFHYFRLLELCGEQASEEVPEKFVFHRRTLCAELMVTNSRLGHHLLAMQSSLLLHYVMSDRKVELSIPNFSKYLGKYQTKKSPNTPNKRKEKEKKRKESKYKPSEVLQLYNDTLSKDLGHCRSLGSGEHLKNCIEALQWLPDEKSWRELFSKCDESDYLMGRQDNASWKVSLTWLVDYDNAVKVLNGNYENKAPKKFEWEPSEDVLRAIGEIE